MTSYDKRGKDPKRMLFFIATLLIVAVLSSCSNQPKETKKEEPQAERKEGPKQEKPKEAYTIKEALNDDHVVVVQKTDDLDAFYARKPGSVKVYNLEKLFAFERNVEQHGGKKELKISTFLKNGPPITNTLSYEGKFIKYTLQKSTYKCQSIISVRTGNTVELIGCKNKGEKVPNQTVVSDTKQHFETVREKFEKQNK